MKNNNEIKVRNITFSFDKVPKHWVLDNPIMTHFSNSMHIVFPSGEKFFIRSVRKFAKEIKDNKLSKDIKGFCGQEGIHSREHERFWDIMEDQGLNPGRFEKFLNKVAFSGKLSMENVLVKGLNKLSPRLGDKMSLSVTAGLEHYTAILANALFNEPFSINDKIAPQMLELMFWHASEEIEHKAVCFDVLREVDDSYILRISGYSIASVVLWLFLGVGQVYFISQDKDIDVKKLPANIQQFIQEIVFGKTGQGLSKNMLSYFRPNFHPDDIDDRHLAEMFFSNKSYG
ncbi:MAG: metal-dependent hydrolase [Chitinophagales bacterium]|nr:metal-dependent hydrolase [Chitinophagales bacterium]MCZ2393703.1 metal-dependent hydrolase [Chitinophagales bacterium]